jgi:hypothetical protein
VRKEQEVCRRWRQVRKEGISEWEGKEKKKGGVEDKGAEDEIRFSVLIIKIDLQGNSGFLVGNKDREGTEKE